MRNWKKYLYENRRKIFITIAIGAFLLFILRFANYMAKQSKQEAEKQRQEQKNNTAVTNAQNVMAPTQSVTDNTQLSQTKVQENADIVKTFVEACNQKNGKVAYELLSQDCKEAIFKEEQQFITQYMNKIFQTPKTYELELWKSYDGYDTYKIIYNAKNLLQTGGAINESNFVDYITTVTENGTKKLNINQFIGKKKIEKESTVNDIQIAVTQKLMYMDYEIYHFTIKNYTPNNIVLSDGQDANSIVLVDENNHEIISYLNEIEIHRFSLQTKHQKELDIKFNKNYNPNLKIEEVKFKTIYTNQEQYNQNKQEAEKLEIRIAI